MSSHKDIFLYRHTEESEILEGGGKDIPVGLQIICLYIFSVIKDLSRIGIIQPQHKLDDSGFSGAVMTHKGCDLTFIYLKRKIMDYLLILIGKRNISKFQALKFGIGYFAVKVFRYLFFILKEAFEII